MEGYLINGRGNKWYKLQNEEKYIYDGHVSYIGEIPYKIRSCDVYLLTTRHTAGTGLPIYGSVDADRNVTLTAWVENSSGTEIISTPPWAFGNQVTYLNGTAFDNSLDFRKLTVPGNYTLYLKATDGKNTKTDSFAFQVVSPSIPSCAVPSISTVNTAGGKQVTLSCGTSGATLYYTLDGSQPTTSSTRYSGPFTLTNSAPISVMAVRSGYNNSNTSQYITVDQAIISAIETTDTPQGVRVRLSAESGATIYYSLNGGVYQVYSQPFTITSETVVTAYAAKYGKKDSYYVQDTVRPTAPAAVTVKLSGTNSKIPMGQTAAVHWNEVSNASYYKVSLYHEGILMDTQTQTENLYSFKTPDAGVYSVTVQAVNLIGSSPLSNTVEVEAMEPVTVSFYDAARDGNDPELLSRFVVDYGSTVSKVPAPSRRGHTFTGWRKNNDDAVSLTGYLSAVMTEDTTYTANYLPNIYTVTWLDVDGNVIDTEEVQFEHAATPPDYSSMVPAFHSFTGWAVVDADKDSFCDYTSVDSDMDLQALIHWTNPTQPVGVQVGKSTFDGGYDIPITLIHNDDQDRTVWLVVALKVIDKNTGVEQTVKVERQEVDLAAGETKSIDFELSVSGTNGIVAGTAEVLVLERKDNGTTGSAYSETVQVPVTAKTAMTPFTDWNPSKPAEKDGRVIETKTEYRYRNKKFTTSSSSSLSGWSYYKTTSTPSEYGSWSGWSDSYVSSNDYRQVQTKTQYKYYRCICGNNYYHGWYGGASCSNYSSVNGSYCPGWVSVTNREYLWSDVSFDTAAGWPAATSDGQVRRNTLGTSSWWYYWSRYRNEPYNHETRTVYRYRTRYDIYTYHFWQWDSWSSWSTTAISSNSDREVDKRTVYRYSDTYEVTSYKPTGTATGTTYSFDGVIQAEDDLQGKVATIMVYKTQNIDANQYQTQYIGQTVIGEGNTYSFSLIPLADPTEESGNYVVALGIEGSTGLLNVDIIEAPKHQVDVTFSYVDENGETVEISSQTIAQGEDAVVPEVPEREGYSFLGWDTRTTNIISDTDIQAIYAPREVVIVFVDWANQSIGYQAVQAGSPIVPPHEPEAEGKTFLGWDVLMEDANAVATEHMVVSAVYETAEYTVRFLDENGSAVSTQSVKYGEAATLPEALSVPGKVFLGWSTDVSWWDVTSDLDVTPILAYKETTAAPLSNLPEFTSGFGTTLELTAEEGATIYYTTDGTVPTKESTVYTEPLFLLETTMVTAMAVSEGKNDSELVNISFYYDDTPVPADPAETTVIATHEVEVEPGETFDLNVSLQDNPGLLGSLIFVECDRSVFGLNTDEDGNEYVTSGVVCENGTTMLAPYGNEGWQILWYQTEATTETGSMFTLPIFVSEEAAAGTYTFTISYSPANTISSSYDEAQLTAKDVVISGGEAEYTPGDANGDGSVTLADVILIARYLIDAEQIPEECMIAADFSGDGAITNYDVICIARKILEEEEDYDDGPSHWA